MKKVDMLKLFSLMLLVQLPANAADKPPRLEYGIIKNGNKAPPSTSTHPPPANDPTRGCNAENYCRHLTLTVENPSGTRVEAVALVEVGAHLNSSAPGTEAIAAGIAAWSLNHTKSGRLIVLINSTAADDSAQIFLHLKAISRGIARMGLDFQYRSIEDMGSLPSGDGNQLTVTVGSASNKVDLNFLAQVKSLGETDIIMIMEYAKAKITSHSKMKG